MYSDELELIPALTAWLPLQRWYAGTTADGVTVRSRQQVVADQDGASVEHLVLGVPDPTTGELRRYQVWLGLRGELPDKLGHARIGHLGDRVAYDALHDRALSSLLIGAIADSARLGGIQAVAEPGAVIDRTAPGLVTSAEQSNTSIIYGDSAILKVFRLLQPGPNPDVELTEALHRAGSTHIAPPLGELDGEIDGEPTTLALLTTFFANSAEGWSMATASVRDLMAEGDLHADEVGGDFAAESYRLGRAVAEVHATLAAQFGTEMLDGDRVAAVWREATTAAEQAAAVVPMLAPYLDDIRSVYDAATASAAGMIVQRIHGDLHLGQVLRTLTGWAIIDFEGEPAKPLAYRRQFHSPLRDIAGMLRSYDYAARMPLVTGSADTQHTYRAAEWAKRNRQSFCDGYVAFAAVNPLHAGPLLRAFELDKAVYEVVYEHGHRPSWVPVPMHAITSLTRPEGPS